jgi:hypothetical protein
MGKKGARKIERYAMGLEKLHRTTLTDRLNEFAQNARDEAETLEPGPERQALMEKARKADATSEAWANSPGFQIESPIAPADEGQGS